MKLFGHPDSGHAYKVRLCLSVANLEHTYEQVDIFAPRDSRGSEFRDSAKFSEVPLLIDNGQAYVQSNAILIHLARTRNICGAQNGQQFQTCLEWLFWEANKIGLCLPQLRASEKFPESRLNKGARQWLEARYEHDVNLLDAALSKSHGFIAGAEPTIADFSLCGYLYFSDEAKVNVPSHVASWLTRITELPGWQHPYDLMRP